MTMTTGKRSRRAIIGAGIGALAATLAVPLGRAPVMRAATGDPVILGQANLADSPTMIRSPNTNALVALSDTGWGIEAISGENSAIAGLSHASRQPAILGQSANHSTGVIGVSGGPNTVSRAGKASTGVYGEARADKASRGVWGRSRAGRGVYGEATDGTGVYAQAGVNGIALQAVGAIRLSSSGIVKVAIGSSTSGWVAWNSLGATTKILGLLQDNGGAAFVRRVQKDLTNKRFRFHLSRANSTGTSLGIAWLVLV